MSIGYSTSIGMAVDFEIMEPFMVTSPEITK